jgi:hypothetical protein
VWVDFVGHERIREAELERCQETLGGLGVAPTTKPPSKRIRALEHELTRKQNVLPEAAATLVLATKAWVLWTREDDDRSEARGRR